MSSSAHHSAILGQESCAPTTRGEACHGAELQAAFDRVQGGPEAADARRAARDAVKRLHRAKPGLEKRDAAALVDALGALDEAYHRLRYARRDAVPPPHQVFEKLLGRGSVVDEAADALMETLPADLQIEESDDPLHQLYRLRWREGAWLFGPFTKWRLDERLEPGEPTTTPKRNDPVAAPTIHKWRDAARTWACREYAYAVPGDEALNALASACCSQRSTNGAICSASMPDARTTTGFLHCSVYAPCASWWPERRTSDIFAKSWRGFVRLLSGNAAQASPDVMRLQQRLFRGANVSQTSAFRI